jgi:DNA-binding Lrp family transcriptional regulator
MREDIDGLDLALIRASQEGIKLSSRPYELLGREVDIGEGEVIDRLQRLIEAGAIRRFSATIGHRALGIVANAMIVWRVPEDEVARVGEVMASFDEVTHCYERTPRQEWPYNLYTVVHSPSREECREVAAEISRKVGISDYQVLFSEREFKKTGARI